MQKNGMKSFICSFILSLLAVIAVNKAVFYTPNSTNEQTDRKKIKAKNISLFSTPIEVAEPSLEVSLAKTAESEKKIADISALEELTAPFIKEEIKLSLIKEEAASLLKTADIPQPAPEKKTSQPINMDLASAEEIVLSAEKPSAEIANMALEEKSIIYADISDTLADEKTQVAIEPSVIYGAENIIKNDHKVSGKIVLASNETISELAEKATEKTDDDEIPLLESTELLHKNIDVLQSADVTQVAMLEPNTLVSEIEQLEDLEEKTLAEADLKQNEWTQMSAKEDDNPWVLAKGNKFAKNKANVEHFAKIEEEQTAKEALTPKATEPSEEETQLAYKMIQNLLIPIPEEIMNDADLTPQLSSSPEDKPQEKLSKPQTKQNNGKKDELKDSEKQSGLFKSIASWFSGESKKGDSSGKADNKGKKSDKKSGISFFGSADDASEDGPTPQIMPAELRLSFQPNRAEISGQTLRWIHAFGDNARDNDDIYIEVRIDGTSSFALQQKRLNLLSTILANRGVDFRKINIVFTSREPNSFIIRNIRFNNNEEVVVNKDNNNSYYRPW